LIYILGSIFIFLFVSVLSVIITGLSTKDIVVIIIGIAAMALLVYAYIQIYKKNSLSGRFMKMALLLPYTLFGSGKEDLLECIEDLQDLKNNKEN
jgi:hypothetical protein